jgi:Bacterial PH domain
MTGKKVEYQSVPYRSITRFSIETAGTFDLDAELKITPQEVVPVKDGQTSRFFLVTSDDFNKFQSTIATDSAAWQFFDTGEPEVEGDAESDES